MWWTPALRIAQASTVGRWSPCQSHLCLQRQGVGTRQPLARLPSRHAGAQAQFPSESLSNGSTVSPTTSGQLDKMETRHAQPRILALPIAAIFSMAACGGGSSGGPVAATPTASESSTPSAASASDPCKTITAAEVSPIMLVAVTAKTDPGGGYSFSDPSGALQAVISVIDLNDLAAVKSGSADATGAEAEDIPGVGDGAFVSAGDISSQGGVLIEGTHSLSNSDLSNSDRYFEREDSCPEDQNRH